METPICIADAKTLVEHIHAIKSWIYNGQLRLVVPTGTFEEVDQMHQKSKESKLAPAKEAARPRSSGKLAKKEHPTFDISPLLAKSFLSRLQTWKGEEGISEQKEFFQEKEKHEAVNFQQPSEIYTPWKDLEEEEVQPELVEERPSTWAEALRRKQYLANGTVGNAQEPKGPAKPKLVAKAAGSEISPWKIKKDAPKISAKDVSKDLRPLMSCALWRLHESIDRNDSNELFLLSSQPEIRKVAQKLNITVRSPRELRDLIVAREERTDLDTFGDLEQEFGVVRNNAYTVKTVKIEQSGDVHASSAVNQEQNGDEKPSEGAERQKELARSREAPRDSQSQHQDSVTVKTLGVKASEGSVTGLNKTKTSQMISSQIDREHQDINESMPSVNGVKKTKVEETPNADTMKGTQSNPDGYSAPMASHGSLPLPIVSKSEQQIMSYAVAAGGQPSQQASKPLAAAPAPALAPEEPEDSDEEVVVFVPQPKRFSAQKKPAQQSLRPTTPNVQPPKNPIQQSSRPSTPGAQPQNSHSDRSPKPSPRPVHSQPKPKHANRGRNPTVIAHGHPQPSGQPTVIDPDAFGRSFAVNPNPNPRPSHNGRSHHRPRASFENVQLSQGHGNSRQHGSRPSPPRDMVQLQSPRLSPNVKKAKNHGSPNPRSHSAQPTSPQRRSITPEPEATAPRGHGSNHAHPKPVVQPKTLKARMVDSEEFIPGKAIAEAQFGPIGTPPPKSNDSKASEKSTARPTIQVRPKVPEPGSTESDNFIPRSLMPVIEPKAQKVEVNGFVPRTAMAASRIKAQIPEPTYLEPRASMPEVQYVLKTGSTRAATRGRGRLWMP